MSTGPTTNTNNSTSGSTSSPTTGNANSLNSLSATDFLQLMITELQNQDPLDPTDESEIMAQTASLSQITASTQLTSTLDSMQISQNLTGAASLIGANVTGLDASGNSVSGVVSSVQVSGGAATLQVGNDTIPLDNVQTIQPNSG